jgi:predicted transcriptional regulator
VANSTELEAAVIRTAGDVLVAYLSNNTVAPADLAGLVKGVRQALQPDAGPQDIVASPSSENRSAPKTEPASRTEVVEVALGAHPVVARTLPTPEAIAASVQPNYLVSFEDGGQYRSLRRHLMAKHGLTPDQYRARWGLPADYPMVAPSYAAERSEVAKRIGLGRSRSSKKADGKVGPRRAGRASR